VSKEQATLLRELCGKCLSKALALRASQCRQPVPVPDLACVVSLAQMFDAAATLENGVDAKDAQSFARMTELWFLFCLLWTVGITVDEQGRMEMDSLFREIDPQISGKGLVYDFYVDPKKKAWAPWDDKVNHAWKPSFELPFYKLFVPTVDTVRYSAVIGMLVKAKRHTLVTGESGVAKSSIIFSVLAGLDESFAWLNINFSAQTNSVRVSDTIETRLEKRTKDTFAPPGGRRLVAFIDDFNMPEKEVFGAQPPLELLRMWIEYDFWYDLKKQAPKYVKEMQLLAAMGHPGGGRTVISPRVLSCFHVLNITFPSEVTVKRIFGTLINAKLVDFDEEIKPVGEMMTAATYELYQKVCAELLPTPDKPHYVFNLRDISRVFEGVLQMDRNFYDSKDGVIRLWAHEVLRVFSDRLINEPDREAMHKIVSERLEQRFGTAWGRIFTPTGCPPFGDFMREMSGDKKAPYEEMNNPAALKKHVEDKLEDYNMEPGFSAMDLVLFRDAIDHVCRLRRVISMPRGNAMLVGVGGSGRQSLAKLTAYLSDYQLFQVEITRQYKKTEFHEDLRKLYNLTGVQNKPTVFLFNDTQIIETSFLEDINSILTSGEVPNLYGAEDLGALREALKPLARAAGEPETNDALWAFFIEQARANMHIVLAMSPIGDSYRNYVRMFPSLVNCTTIDWFADWPKAALQEVALRFLETMELGDATLVANVGSVFASAHYSVIDASRRMKVGLQRHNYTTPTNYLSLVKGYCDLLREKRRFVGELRSKLVGGITKLVDTAVQVSEMSVELELKKKVVAKAQTECEELLVVIVQEKRQVDEQQRTVTADAEKIGAEEVTCKAQAEEAQADLDKALPALEAAQKALELLNKKDMSEIKAYQKPPDVVSLVLSGVMVLVKCEPSWNEAKKQLGDPNFLNRLINYDKDQLVESLLNKVSKFTTRPEFDPETVGSVSRAAKSLCMWVRAMEVYGRIAKDVAPKRMKLQTAMRTLAQKQEILAAAKASLQEITDKVLALKKKYDENVSSKERLKQESEDLEIKLGRATQLVDGLSGERVRWQASIARYDEQFAALPGDCLVAAAFLSYAGPFPSEYRVGLVNDSWLAQVRNLSIPSSADFDFCNFLSNPEDVRDWNIQGLPQDAFSTENGVLVTRGTRWPLMIDPQEQANKWVKKMEKDNGIKLVTLKQSDFLRTLENAISFGAPVLMQEILEELDPSLDPIMSKAIVKIGNRNILRLGDKEVEYNFDFRFYLTTKLGNPHYTPEISTKSTLVNFSVKEQGLEDQLLGAVVRKERPELEVEKNNLVIAVAAGKRKIVELEDLILRMLTQASGSLLDDEDLVLTLQSSKNTSEEVKASLDISERTEKEIDKAREGYRPCAYRASILYFMLNDLSRVDPMYQFSLDAYTSLFNISLDKSTRSDELQERIKHLNEYHTHFVYRSTCRGLFEAHKLLFAFQVCAKIMQGAKKINVEEYNFFLRGGQVFDKSQQPPNPCADWLNEQAWDHITELDKLYNFRNIASSFSSNAREWKSWHRHNEPETSAVRLPGEWENKCTELQRIIIVRCLRPDRIVFAVTSFIVNNLGQKFTEPPQLDLTQVVVESVPTSPLIFVLSPGVDPTNQLMQLAEQKGITFSAIALGQGQSPHAIRLIDEGITSGHWVLLANCHLMMSWLNELEKIIEQLPGRSPRPQFRLWLSSAPHPKFPIGILQKGIKMTTEPPKGLKANMSRLYANMSDAKFQRCGKPAKYKKLLFSLCWFHSVLVDRRKFLNLGWNIPYDFNDSDFDVSELCLSLYLDEYELTPWDALKYLVSEINYGGRVTDDWDRRLMNVYMNSFFNDEALATPNFRLSSLPQYCIPDDGSLQSYRDFCATLPGVDRPEAFGQHPNADIASQISEGSEMLQTIVSLQPRTAEAEGAGPEARVLTIADDLSALVPGPFAIRSLLADQFDEPTPLVTVLVQEMQRYNAVLTKIRTSLDDLKKAIKGLVVMSSELEVVFNALLEGRVPASWLTAYPSLKPLAAWSRDLLARILQLQTWAEQGQPKVYWLTGFTYPTGFLTALMQTSARKNNVSIDTLAWDFLVINLEEKDILQPPKEGAYVKGLWLEGAGWNDEQSCLTEPEPMELIYSMPIIQFKPVEARARRGGRGVYQCPLYMYPLRTGSRERPSFMITVDLKSGPNTEPEHWVKRGTALLLALDH